MGGEREGFAPAQEAGSGDWRGGGDGGAACYLHVSRAALTRLDSVALFIGLGLEMNQMMDISDLRM
jgi:hypothetical protein